jgi:hypothetical protein
LLDICYPGEKTFRRFDLSEISGDKFHILSGFNNGDFVFEMKMPLKSESAFPSLAKSTVQQFGLDIEIPEMEFGGSGIPRSGSDGSDMGGGGGGMRGGGGMGGGGMMGGGGPGGGFQTPESYKATFQVVMVKP